MKQPSNINHHDVAKLFSEALMKGLFRHYGRVPSASKLADQFNLRAKGTATITRETARKWLRGISVPEMGRLKVLIEWLDLFAEDFLGKSQGSNLLQFPSPPSSLVISSKDLQLKKLMAIASQLNPDETNVLLELANILGNRHPGSQSNDGK